MNRVELPLGRRFGDTYEIKNKLGEGGQAAVYDAFDLETRQAVALKIFDSDKPRDEFRKEARTQAS